MTSHPIVHVEIPASDVEAAGRFYRALFGWDVQHMAAYDYSTFAGDGGPGGGFPRVDGQLYAPGRVLVYVDTDDIDASLARAAELGGRTVAPRTEIPGIGWFAVFADPSGNHVALFTALAG